MKLTNKIILIALNIAFAFIPFGVVFLRPEEGITRSLVSMLMFMGLCVVAGIVYIFSVALFFVKVFKKKGRVFLVLISIVIAYAYFIIASDYFINLKVINGENVTRYDSIKCVGEDFQKYIAEKKLDYISEDIWRDYSSGIWERPVSKRLKMLTPEPYGELMFSFNEELTNVSVADYESEAILIKEKANGLEYKTDYILIYNFNGQVLKYYQDKNVFKNYYSWN